jgi:hypothetical protein
MRSIGQVHDDGLDGRVIVHDAAFGVCTREAEVMKVVGRMHS